jgi:hypothetical protein
MVEHAKKIFEQRFGKPEIDAMQQALQTLNINCFTLAMQVVDADSRKGGRFDASACSNLVEKIYLDNFVHWSKDDLLLVVVMVMTGLTMERVQSHVDDGSIGVNAGSRDLAE